MVKPFVELNKIVVRKGGNGRGITTRFKTIGIVGEEVFEYLIVNLPAGVGIGALHLIVNNSLVFNGAVLVGKFIMPTLLLQYPFICINQRIENSIKIYMYEVKVILVVHAGHGVHREILGGKGIQEGVEGSLEQNIKRTLYRKAGRAVQN